jgi:hypothetical protein
MSEVVVVNAKVTVGIVNAKGALVNMAGIFAVERARVAATLRALPGLVDVVDQDPTEEMIRLSVARGLASPTAPAADKAAPDDASREEIVAALAAAGLPTTGNRATLLKRLREAAGSEGATGDDGA